MAQKIVAIVSYLFLFSMLAFAGTNDSYSAPPAAIELRQYLTMAIVAVVCIAGGVLLFLRTGHS